MIPDGVRSPSQRGETWNDTEAINRHRQITPAERIALAVEAGNAALRFANAPRRLLNPMTREAASQADRRASGRGRPARR
jgi:hypothetical protein